MESAPIQPQAHPPLGHGVTRAVVRSVNPDLRLSQRRSGHGIRDRIGGQAQAFGQGLDLGVIGYTTRRRNDECANGKLRPPAVNAASACATSMFESAQSCGRATARLLLDWCSMTYVLATSPIREPAYGTLSVTGSVPGPRAAPSLPAPPPRRAATRNPSSPRRTVSGWLGRAVWPRKFLAVRP